MRDDAGAAIGARVRGVAAERGVTTQQEIAEMLGVDRKTIGRRLSGEVPFTGPELLALANRLGVPVADLFPRGGSTSAATVADRPAARVA